MKGQSFQIGAPAADGLCPLVPFSAQHPVSFGARTATVTALKATVGDQVLVGASDDLYGSLSVRPPHGDVLLRLEAAQKGVRSQPRLVPLAFAPLPGKHETFSFPAGGDVCSLAVSLGLNRGTPPEHLAEIVNAIKRAVPVDAGVGAAVAALLAGSTVGFGSALAAYGLFRAADKAIDSLFGECLALNVSGDVHFEAGAPTQIDLCYADILSRYANVGGPTAADFAYDPATHELRRRGQAEPVKRAYAIVRLKG